MKKPSPTRTSYAHGRYDLPGDPFAVKLREARIARQFEAEANPDRTAQRRDMDLSEAQRRGEDAKRNKFGRGSNMIQSDKPYPAPRPTWADGSDRAAFNAKWSKERRDAKAIEPELDRVRQIARGR